MGNDCVPKIISFSNKENVLLITIVCEFFDGRKAVVLGDFNVPSLVWTVEGGMLGSIGRHNKMFMNCYAVAGLTQWGIETTLVSSRNTLD